MKKNLVNWGLSSLGLASVAFSLVLVFSGIAKASCYVQINCNDGSVVSCSGDKCNATGSTVTCSVNGAPVPETHSCQGGGDN